jgi:hypothetical protein
VRVAREPRGDHALGPRGLGDRRGSGVGLARSRIGVAGPVVAELAEGPGAEDIAESGKTEVDLGVRVAPKRALELPLQLLDLCRDLPEHRDQGTYARGVRGGQGGRCLELWAPQRLRDLLRTPSQVALAAAAAKHGRDLRHG